MRMLGVLGAFLVAAACGTGSEENGDRDAGPPRDAGPSDGGTTERDGGNLRDGGPQLTCATSSPRPEQGYGGGAIDGRLVVFALDDRGEPLAYATVLVHGPTFDARAATDEDGCAEIDVASGPVDVHVMLNGWRYVSWQAIAARELTVELRPVVWNRPVASFEGQVVGLESVLSATTAQVGRAAEVDTLDLTPFGAAPAPATRTEDEWFVPENVVVEGAERDLPSYRRVVYPEQINGLFALAGPYMPMPNGLQRTHIGVVVSGPLTEGQRSQQDVEVTHALSETLEIAMPNTGGLPFRAIVGGVFLPNEGGVIKLAPNSTGATARVSVPPLTGAFAGATYGAIARVQDSGSSPSIAVDFVVPGSASTRLTIDAPRALPSEIAFDGRTISAETPRSDLVQLYLVGGSGWSTWVVNRAGVDAGAFVVELPEVPPGIEDPYADVRRLTLSVSDYADFDATEELPLAAYFNGLRLRRQVRRNLEVVF